MPIYEYRCNDCGTSFEELVLPGDVEPPCVECGSENRQRLISNSSFRLKGSGWYVTDYAHKKDKSSSAEKSDEKKEKQSSEGEGKSSGTASESSTEAKKAITESSTKTNKAADAA